MVAWQPLVCVIHKVVLVGEVASATFFLLKYLDISTICITFVPTLKLKAMFNLELTEFNLYVLFNSVDYLTLVDMKKELTNAKESLERSKKTLIELTFEFGINAEAVTLIEQQLVVVNKNIESVSKAILMKEAEPFEHWQEFEKANLHVFCLN